MFDKILDKVIESEGGYKLHTVKNDKGGMTYAGISRNNWPDWYGWHLIDVGKDEKLKLHVYMFYHENFWDKIKGDKIGWNRIAYSIFDFAHPSVTGERRRETL